MKKNYFLLGLIFVLIFVFYLLNSVKVFSSQDPLKIWEKYGANLRVFNNSWDKIRVLDARIESFKVNPGDIQKNWVRIESQKPIQRVIATIKTDKIERDFEVRKLKEEIKNEKYISLFYFEWKVNDVTKNKDYATHFKIFDIENNSINWLVGWFDGPGGEFGTNCKLSGNGFEHRGDSIYGFVYNSYGGDVTLGTLGGICQLNADWGLVNFNRLIIAADTNFQINPDKTLIIPSQGTLTGPRIDVSQQNITINIANQGRILLKKSPLLYDPDNDGYWNFITTNSGRSPSSADNFRAGDCDPYNSQYQIIRPTCVDEDNDGYCVGTTTMDFCLSANADDAQAQAAQMSPRKILVDITSDYVEEVFGYGDIDAATQVFEEKLEKKFVENKENLKNKLKIILNFLNSLLKQIISQIKIKEAYGRPPCDQGFAYEDCIYNPPPDSGPADWTIDLVSSVYINNNSSKFLIVPFYYSEYIPNSSIDQSISYRIPITSAPNNTTVEVRMAYKENNGTWSVSKDADTFIINGATTIYTTTTPSFYITASDLNDLRIGLAIKVSSPNSGYVRVNVENITASFIFNIKGYRGHNDCYDRNPEAFPGQTKYFPTHRGDNSFDYNCNGVEELFESDLCSESSVFKQPKEYYVFNFKILNSLKGFIKRLIKFVLAREPGSGLVCWVDGPPGCGASSNKCYKSYELGNCISNTWLDVQLCR